MELREIYKPIQKDLFEVKEEIRKQLAVEDDFMKRVVEDIVDSSGKLLRPALALLAFSTGNNNRKSREEIIKTASVIELVHTASLIHDDVIDETILRRHRTTLQARWGDKISVLFGDYLFCRSFAMLCQLGHSEIVSALANTISLICEGELKQISRAYGWDLSEEDYLSIIKKKTASLFSFSCLSGGHLGRVGADEIKALVNYGLNFGIAFQMIDDCLDFIGDEKATGKSLGSDLRKGKVTLPLIYLLSSIPEEVRKEIVESISPEQNDAIILLIKQMLQEYQVMQRCVKRITQYMERAKKEAKKIENVRIRKSFINICDYSLVNPLESCNELNVRQETGLMKEEMLTGGIKCSMR
ncbi:polyprenyl synthetase family protein [bacterium]|nr:polyprenyl synthetase family protein [bacterium]